jgi:hypothetical protein
MSICEFSIYGQIFLTYSTNTFVSFMHTLRVLQNTFLCNGGALYAPSSFPSISNMLCEASVLARWGMGGGEQGGKNYFTTLFLGS